MTKRSIFLIGSRGSGKSTIGALLAAQLDAAFIDTDQIVQQSGSVTKIVEREGWTGFRQRESQALLSVPLHNAVIATGGGIVLSPENCSFMKDNGSVIFLDAPPTTLAARLLASPDSALRPSLTGKGLVEEIIEVLTERLPLYNQTAHLCISADEDPEKVVAEIVRLCK